MNDKPRLRLVQGMRELHRTPDLDYWGLYQNQYSVPIVGYTPSHAWERFLRLCGPMKEQATGDL